MEFPIRRVVLFKHGVGHFEREGRVAGDGVFGVTFKQSEVSDVLKSLTVLDLDGGHVASVSYDSTKPLDQLLSEVAIDIPDQGSLVGLLPQIKGARVRLHTGVSDPAEGIVLGVDTTERSVGDAVVHVTLVSIVSDSGEVRSFDLHQLAGLQILDGALRRDLDYYLRTLLSAKKKDARSFAFFAQGEGERRLRVSYTLESPVWKATYRILLGEEGKGPIIQGWAVVDNPQDEDWENVELALVSGLPVSFRHDLYTPRYVRRPEVRVQETTGVLPPEMEQGLLHESLELRDADGVYAYGGGPGALAAAAPAAAAPQMLKRGLARAEKAKAESAVSSTPAQVRERKIGDLFEYQIEHPVTIRRNQSALVPIVLRGFEGKPVLLYNKANRPDNPIRCVEMKNTTGLTLEGGPVTVVEAGSYVGEAMLDTLKPDESRLVPYAVELSVRAHDHVESRSDRVDHVVIREGTLFAHSFLTQQTTYHFDNHGDQDYVLCLEHPRGGTEWVLYDTVAAEETTESYWRFRLPLAAKGTTKFVVRQKMPTRSGFALGGLDEKTLGLWIRQKYVDRDTETTLRQLLALQQEAARHQTRLQTLERERTSIAQEQSRIRENLQALGDRASEKDLRERFVRTLNQQEDRLEAIAREAAEVEAKRDVCRDKMLATLGQIKYDASV